MAVFACSHSRALSKASACLHWLMRRSFLTRGSSRVPSRSGTGETLGIVGESGSGKTITSLSVLRLIPRPAARIVKGEIWLDGENLQEKSDKEMRQVRGRKIAMILQDPQTWLNPVFTVGNQLIEAIRIHFLEATRALLQGAEQALRMVKVPAPAKRLGNYPHQMSGGMKQRVVGAIGISCAPKLLIADEPTTALDVTIQRNTSPS